MGDFAKVENNFENSEMVQLAKVLSSVKSRKLKQDMVWGGPRDIYTPTLEMAKEATKMKPMENFIKGSVSEEFKEMEGFRFERNPIINQLETDQRLTPTRSKRQSKSVVRFGACGQLPEGF